jgi:Ca-activated chloride channel family protein
MTKLSPQRLQNIEDQLTQEERPAPPPDLLGRIKAEIPEAVDLTTPIETRLGSKRRWIPMSLAASLMVAALGTMVALRVKETAPEIAPQVVQKDVAGKRQDTHLDRVTASDNTDNSAEGFLSQPASILEPDLGRANAQLKARVPAPEVQSESSLAANAPQPRAPERSSARDELGKYRDSRQELSDSADKKEVDVEGGRSSGAGLKAQERLPASVSSEDVSRSLIGEAEVVFGIPDAAPRELDRTQQNESSLENKNSQVVEQRLRRLAEAIPPATEEAIMVRHKAKKMPMRTEEELRQKEAELRRALSYLPGGEAAATQTPPSTGGTAEPNDRPFGDMFFESAGVNPFIDTEDDHLSTFGLDVDTGSYTVARRYLEEGHLPPAQAIRVEEFINYFDYADQPPVASDFAIHAQAGPSPFASGPRYHLVRFNVRARTVDAHDRKPATLIFVVDVSGSMRAENRLGLVKQSLYLLLDQLRSSDRVGLVIYGSRGEVLLEPTGDLESIRSAINRLVPQGSTNAEEGLVLGYGLATEHFRSGAINRIILCSDGVANVGRTGPDSILKRIESAADRGIELTTVGFGMGNYNDVLMEQLADKGDGNYSYVDDLAEAKRVFVENLTGTLQTIASDAKLQVEFDPLVVSRYRLLGYENRDIADERFRDDTVDAGEVGAGHSVTALYEIKLQQKPARNRAIATLRLRYFSKRQGQVLETAREIHQREVASNWEQAPRDFKLAAFVAEFAEILRGSYWAKDGDLQELFGRSQRLSGEFGGNQDVAEFVSLLGKAARIKESLHPSN